MARFTTQNGWDNNDDGLFGQQIIVSHYSTVIMISFWYQSFLDHFTTAWWDSDDDFFLSSK